MQKADLMVVAFSALVAFDLPPETPKPPVMECHLDVKSRSGADPSRFTGEFTLKNTSSKPLKIVYNCHLLQYLDLDVKDERGRTLPKAIHAYGAIFGAQSLRPIVFTIAPGEVYREDVALFLQVDRAKHPIKPAKYSVEAVYKCKTTDGEVTVKSNRVTIEVTAK